MTEEENKQWLLKLINNYQKIIKKPNDIDKYNLRISSDLFRIVLILLKVLLIFSIEFIK